MKSKSPFTRMLVPLVLMGLGGQAVLTGQDETNYIRQEARFVVVEAFGTDNTINNFPTDEDDFASGVPFADFVERLNVAFQQGRGGIINFDNPIYGGAFVDYDRTQIRRFIEAEERRLIDEEGVVFDEQSERQAFIDAAREEAYASGLADFSRRIPVVARPDPGIDDPDIMPESETVSFDRLVALFGPNRDRELILRRGPQNYSESALANNDFPASETLGTTNDEYFWNVGRSGYAGGAMRAISQPFTLNAGVLDVLFDTRDNVTAVGFALLSVNNFQYWQGLGGTPDNPDNIRVLVEFSDGSSEKLTSHTAQSLGGWDTFFGIEAPEGASIERLRVRIIGRNFRTFVFMDDFAFITEPAAPFLASESVASAAVGRNLYYSAVFGQQPTEVSVSGLPPGLSYDAATQVISGMPTQEGTFTATFTLTNPVGTVEESMEFTILPAVEDALVPLITNAAELQAVVTLGRALAPISVETSLDEEAAPGELSFFTVAYRLDDGARVLVPLEASGIGLADGVFAGTPTTPAAVGTYEIEVFVFNRFGGDSAVMTLEVFPVVPRPNFDGNEITDVAWRDAASGRIHILQGAGNYYDLETGAFGVRSNWNSMDTGLTAASRDVVALADFDLNNQTDISVYQEHGDDSRVDMLLFHEEMGTVFSSINDLSAGWQLKATGDMRGDGNTSFLWFNPVGDRYAVWHAEGSSLGWGGLLFNDGVAREFVLHGDFSGDGTRDLLFRRSPTHYEIVDATIGTSTLTKAVVDFTMPSADWVPHMAADLNGTGADDLIWKNAATGEFTAWIMGAPTVPTTAQPPVEEGEEGDSGGEDNDVPAEPIEALPGETILPFGSPYEIVVALDVDEDRRRDLILQDRRDGGLHLMLMDGAGPKAPMRRLETSAAFLQVVAAGDYNGDKREDILVRDPATGMVSFKLLGPEGILESHDLGTFGENIEFLTPRNISTDLTLPPRRDDPVAPWTAATPLGNRFFQLDWFGTFYDPPGGGWIYHNQHGFVGVRGESTESLWLIDYDLGWFWTSEDVYPWMFWPNPIQNTWMYYARGTSSPRWFYFEAFDLWITDEELLEFL